MLRAAVLRAAVLAGAMLVAAVGMVAAQDSGAEAAAGAQQTADAAAAAGPVPFEGWRSVQTEHFRIIYEPAHEEAAREVASFAEDVYLDVTETLGYAPETVRVVIRGRTAGANGFYSPFPHSLTLFVTSPSGIWLGARHENWLRLLLIHELTHYVQLSDRAGFFGALSYVFGHDVTVFSFPFMPGWYVEALTTYNETRFTEGGRGRNPFFEMLIKAPVLEGKLWSADQAAYQSAYPPRGRIYVSGYVLADYLTRTYGPGTYRSVHREFVRRPAGGVARAVERVTGRRFDAVYADMHEALIRRYSADARLPQGRRVSPENAGNWYLPVATDRGLYAFVGTVDRRAGIYRLEIDETALDRSAPEVEPPGRRPRGAEILDAELVLPVNPTDPFSFDVSADGSRAAFTVAESKPGHPAGSASFSDLWIADLGTGDSRRITEGFRLRHPALSPNGNRLVAAERSGSYSRLVDVDLATGAVTPLYEPEQASVMNPRIGPDGRRIVFVEHARGFQDIMVYESGTVRPLLSETGVGGTEGRDRYGEYFPRFADAETVLFSSDRSGRLELYRADVESGSFEALVTDRVAAFSGIPFADGVLYGSYSSEGFTLRHAGRGFSSGPDTATAGPDTAVGEPGARPDPVDALLPPESWDPLPEAGVYRDVPKPLLWGPYAELYTSTDGDLRVPAGAYLLGAGVLGRSSWDALLAFDAAALQPRIGFGASYTPGLVRLGYGLDYRYRATGSEEYGATLAQSVSIGATPWYRRHPAAASQLTTAVGAFLESTREREDGFDVSETFTGSDAERETGFFLQTSVARAAFAPAAAYFGGAGGGLGVEVEYTPPLLDVSQHTVNTTSRGRVRIPSGIGHQVIGLGLDATTSTSGSISGELPPRGGATWETGDGDVKALAGVDYRIPLGVFDTPLPGPRPYKPVFLGAGAILWGQTAFYGDVDTGAFETEDSFFLGLEAEGRFNILHLPVSAGAGVATRLDWSLSTAIGQDDVRVYVFASTGTVSRTDGHADTLSERIDSPRERRWGRRRSATADSFAP